MKVWTVILAGVLFAALPNLGNSALEDAGVFVANDYTEFEKRALPAKAPLICSTNYNEYQWFELDKFEQLLLDFENGNNNKKATFRLGTPTMLVALVGGKGEFLSANYCKYLPKEFHEATDLRNAKATFVSSSSTFEYYALKISNTERATITTGWNYLINLVKTRFPSSGPGIMLIVEKTAAGVIYVGSVPN